MSYLETSAADAMRRDDGGPAAACVDRGARVADRSQCNDPSTSRYGDQPPLQEKSDGRGEPKKRMIRPMCMRVNSRCAHHRAEYRGPRPLGKPLATLSLA